MIIIVWYSRLPYATELQVSFVNSINTTKGGTHVLHVADQFVEAIQKRANAKNKGGMDIKPFHVRSHLWAP